MKTVSAVHPAVSKSYANKISSPSFFSRFFSWCISQQKNRLMWLGLSLTSQVCILTPITIMAVLLAGTNLFLFLLGMVAMGASLVTNLAALPTRITIPVYILSIIIDILIIAACAITGFDITKTYI